jgi:hypothetical protein
LDNGASDKVVKDLIKAVADVPHVPTKDEVPFSLSS